MSAKTLQIAPEADPTLPDVLRLDLQLCFALYATSNRMTRLYRSLLEPIGLTYPQYLAMMALWETAPQTVGALGKRLSLDSGTLTPLFKRLEKQGLVERRRDAGDERRVLIDLTPAGEALRTKAAAVPFQVMHLLPISTVDAIELKERLTRLADGLATREQTAGD